MIDRSFLEKIEEMNKVQVITVADRTYSTTQIFPIKESEPRPLMVMTLTAIRQYLKTNVDHLSLGNLLIHISGPEKIFLLNSLKLPFQQRFCFLEASPAIRKFQFGVYQSIEQFIISIQSFFAPTDTVTQITKIVGNLSHEAVMNFNDDGITQKVTAKVGITRVAEVAVPNPVILCPYRTFLEVEQPGSSFIFRIQGKEGTLPTCALFEADGGYWEIKAINNIAGWLRANIPEEITILA